MTDAVHHQDRNPKGWTRDHAKPIALGGRYRANIMLAHYACNNERGRTEPTPEMQARYKAIYGKPGRRRRR